MPSPLSVSSIWVRVSVSVRRCCGFSGLYAFHSSDSAVVGIPRRMIAVLVSYKTTASSTRASLQHVGHWAHHIRPKSTSENDPGGWGQKRSRTSSACCNGTTASVVVFWSTRSLDARLNITLTIHCTLLVAQSSPIPLKRLLASRPKRAHFIGGNWCIGL